MTLLLLALSCSDPAPAPAPAPVAPSAPSLDTGASSAPVSAQASNDATPPTKRNRRPRLRDLVLSPEEVRAIDNVRASWTTKDPDGDRVKIDIAWYVNDVRLSGEERKTLKAGAFKKGDKVYVEVTASDGLKEITAESDPITILNSPPEIQLPRFGIEKIEGFQVSATDPDGDKLRFRLEEAPPGMSISSSGRLHFQGSNESTEGGTFPTRIIAEDPDGEFAAWELQLTLKPGKPEGAPSE